MNYTRLAGLPAAEKSIADVGGGKHAGSARRKQLTTSRQGAGLRRPVGALLRCQPDARKKVAGCIEKSCAGGLQRAFLGSFPQRARSGLGRFVIFWQIRTRCRGQHLRNVRMAVLDRTMVAGQLDEGVNGGNRRK
ncbi:hypothetical protein GCM10009630_59690 [Kribbella jejuensis]